MTVAAIDTSPAPIEHEDARDSRKLGFWLTLLSPAAGPVHRRFPDPDAGLYQSHRLVAA